MASLVPGESPGVSSAAREARDLVREAVLQGWTLRDRSKHWVLFPPTGRGYVVISKTPGGQTWKQKALADLRRHGFLA